MDENLACLVQLYRLPIAIHFKACVEGLWQLREMKIDGCDQMIGVLWRQAPKFILT